MKDKINITIIYGCVKSVTSATALILRTQGVFFGNVGGPRNDNPKGACENIKIMHLIGNYCRKNFKTNRPLNRGLGFECLVDVVPFEGDHFLTDMPHLRSRVLSILKSQGWDGKQPVAIKVPDIAFLSRFFYEAFPEANWVCVRRKSEDIKQSVYKVLAAKKDIDEISDKAKSHLSRWVDSFVRACDVSNKHLPDVTEIETAAIKQTDDFTPFKELVEEKIGLEWNESAARKVFKKGLISKGKRLQRTKKVINEVQKGPDTVIANTRFKAEKNVGKGMGFHNMTIAASVALIEFASLIEKDEGIWHQCGYLPMFLSSIKKPLSVDEIDKWMNDYEHGFFHGLMVYILYTYLHRNRNLYYHPIEVLGLVHHDLFKSVTGIQENHDKRLFEYFGELERCIYYHSERTEGPVGLEVLADRIELMRYSDWITWLDSKEVFNHLSDSELKDIAFFYHTLRPMLLRLYKITLEDSYTICHGIESKKWHRGNPNQKSGLFPRPGEYMELSPGKAYSVHVMRPSEIVGRMENWRAGNRLSWDKLKGIVEMNDYANELHLSPLKFREHLGCYKSTDRRNWIFLWNGFSDFQNDDILKRIVSDGNVISMKAFRALSTITPRYEALMQMLCTGRISPGDDLNMIRGSTGRDVAHQGLLRKRRQGDLKSKTLRTEKPVK